MGPDNKIHAIHIAILCLSIIFSTAIDRGTSQAQQVDTDTLQPGLISSMSFDLYFNLIFLQVNINETGPLWMILDSGFEGSVINQSTLERYNWPATEPHKEAAPGGDIEVAYADSLNITLGDLILENTQLMVIALDGLEPVVGRKVDGILGHDFFSRYTLVIDYQSQKIDIFNSAGYRYSGGGQVFPIFFENNEVFMLASLESGDRPAVRARLKIDTGSSDFIGLNGSFVANEELFEPNNKKIPAQGVAVGGNTENYVTRLVGFRLGDILIKDPVIGYSVDTLRGGDAGTIGGEFLKRFTATFDYVRHRLILKENEMFSNPYEYDMSGIFPLAEPPDFKTIKIANVAVNSPASDAGLLAGDVITGIDGRPAGDYTIAQIREILMTAGKLVHFEILRGGVKISCDIRTKKLI